MGGSSYDRPVYGSRSSSNFGSGMASTVSNTIFKSEELHKDLDPKRNIVCSAKHPIVLMLDVTGSNINFAKVFYDKAPMLHGQIEQQGYLPKDEFELSFSAVGDAYCDSAPLQISDFAYGIENEKWIEKLYLEGSGGGQQTETYELAAEYFNEKCKLTHKDVFPFFFFLADESPYSYLTNRISSSILNITLNNEIPSKTIFTKLMKKFKNNVFVLLNKYQGFDFEESIIRSWKAMLPSQNIILLKEEKSVIDIILGIIAMAYNSRDMSSYIDDMKNRKQTNERIENVSNSLGEFCRSLVPSVPINKLPEQSNISRKSSIRKL